MKKLINNPEDVVKEELQGIELAHPDLVKVFYDPDYIIRADAPVQGKVALVSGGGSGHEPMHGGFVGKGMLDAACPVQYLPAQPQTRCSRPPRQLTVAQAFCISSKTTPAM